MILLFLRDAPDLMMQGKMAVCNANDYTLIVYIGVQMVSGMVKMILQITYLMDLEQKVVLLCAGPGPK